MSRLSLPCIKCGKPLINVTGAIDNQPYGGTEFTTFGHYGSTIHDEIAVDRIRMVLVVNICDTCILRAIEAGVIQSRGEDGNPLLAHHHLTDEERGWVLGQNEKQYGSAYGDDQPVAEVYENNCEHKFRDLEVWDEDERHQSVNKRIISVCKHCGKEES